MKQDHKREKSAEIVPLRGNTKVSREDWITVATDVLISQGIDQVKILNLGERLQVSRSSFYWYFKSRQSLLDALLSSWEETNTRSFLAACEEPAETITEAVCNLFRCFIDVDLFDPQLDFAIRDWSRRSGSVRRLVDRADEQRLAAVAHMFERFGYAPADAEVRARILYYMQLGYYAVDLREPLERRLSYIHGYLEGFTGQRARLTEVEALCAYSREKAQRSK